MRSAMAEWLPSFDYWQWWLLGVGLMVVEVLAPGFYFLWLGVAALLVGVIAWIVPALGASGQWLLFAVLAVASVAGWYAWARRHPAQVEGGGPNRRTARYVGRVLTLETAIVNGEGRARVGDSVWKVRGPDAPAGSRVRVVAASGVILEVERAD